MKRSGPLRRATYRTLHRDESDPEGDPLVYATTDGRMMQRWKIAPGEYVERVMRHPDGSPVRSRPYRARRVDLSRGEEMYRSGASLPAISEALGADSGNLSRALRRRGVTMRKPREYATTFDPDEVVRRFTSGDGKIAIARDLGVAAGRVATVLRAAGLVERGSGAVKGRGRGPGRSVGFETEFRGMKPSVRARSLGRCEARISPNCSGEGTHVHHRKLRSQGGSNALENLLDCCRFCHVYIHQHPTDSYEAGLLVRRDQDPAVVLIGGSARGLDG